MDSEGSASTRRDKWPVVEKVQDLRVDQSGRLGSAGTGWESQHLSKTFDCVRSQEKYKTTAMERDVKLSNNSEVRMLFRDMDFDANPGEEVGQKLELEMVLSRLIEGRTILNLNGVLRFCSEAKRCSALAVVFRMVDASSIHTLLLQDNNISSESWRGAILDVEKDCTSKLSNITVLDLAGNKIKESYFMEGFFRGLKSLSLSRNPIRDGIMTILRDWRDLETLHLQSIASVASQMRNKRLTYAFREIDLSNNALEIETMDALLRKKWPNLKRLVLGNTNIGVKVCELIAEAIHARRLEALESIDLSCNPAIGREGVCILASSLQRNAMPNMREVCLRQTGIGNLGVMKIANLISAGFLKFLETMDLSRNPSIEDMSVVSLVTSFGTGEAPRMKQLCLSSSGLGDDGVLKIAQAVRIGGFRCLERLDLSNNERVTEKSILSLVASFSTGQVLQMRELNLAGTKLGSDSIITLAEAVTSGNLTSLKSVDLSCADCSDVSMKDLVSALGSAKQMEELVFANTGMGDDAARELARGIRKDNFSFLTKLDLSHNTRISMQCWKYLTRGKATSLSELLLESAGLEDSVVSNLAERIKSGGFEFLEKLDLSGNKSLTDRWLVSLAAAFGSGKAKRLKELVFKDMGWGTTGFIELVRSGVLRYPERLVLAKSDLKEVLLADIGLWDSKFIDFLRTIGSDNVRSIEKLDLSGNRAITDESLFSLESCFEKEQDSCLAQSLLRELNLSRTGMGNASLLQLANAIGSGSLGFLEKLDLSDNLKLTDKAMVPLAVSFASGQAECLKELNLYLTGVGDEGVMKLAEALGSGRVISLELLNLSSCRAITDKSWVSLAASTRTGRATHFKVVPDVRKFMEPENDCKPLGHHEGSPPRTITAPFANTAPVTTQNVESEQVKRKQVKRKHVRHEHVNWSHEHGLAREISVMQECEEEISEEDLGLGASWENHDFNTEVGYEEISNTSTGKLDAEISKASREEFFRSEELVEASEDMEWKFQAPEVTWDEKGVGPKSLDLQEFQYNYETRFTLDGFDFRGDVSDSTDTMPMVQEQEDKTGGSQLRSDIQSLGFRSWDQKFNRQQILLLCDVKSLATDAHILFFHVEAMASLIGVGVPYSTVTIHSDQDVKSEIVVQEMMETSWRKFWTDSHDGSFKPIVFERREDTSVVSENNMLHLTKDEALSSFGVSMDATGYQQFMSFEEPLDAPSSQGCEDSIRFQPRWLSWLENLMDHVKHKQLHHAGEQYDSGSSRKDCDGRGTGDAEPLQRPGEGSEQSGSRKRKHVSRELGSQGERAAPTSDIRETVERKKEHKSLIVKVIFLSTATLYKRDSVTRQMNEVQLTDAYPDPHMSSIEPDLTVEFFCASDRFQNVNRMSTTLKAKYQFEGEDDDRLGWYQDLLKLSFQCGENEDIRFGHQGQGGTGFEESASAGSHPQPSRQEGTSLLESRQDGNTPQASWQDGNTPQASRQDGNTPQALRQDGNTLQASWQGGNTPQASRQDQNTLQASWQDPNTPQASRQDGNTSQALREDPYAPQASEQDGNTFHASRQDGNTPQASRQKGNTLQASRLEGGTSQVSQQVRANSPALRQERTNPQTSHQGGSTPHGSRQEAQEGPEGPNLVASVLEETTSPTSRQGRAIPQAETTAGALDNRSEPSCYLEKHQVVSQTEPVELEASNISGKQWSSIDETKFDGSLQWSALLLSLIPNFSGSKRRERNHTSNNGCTTAYKLKSVCLSSCPAFAITPVCKRQMLAYKAESLIEPSDSVRRQIKSTGLYSDVEVEVEGKWFLFGTAMKKYEFKAQKKLCKSIIVGGAGDTNEVSVAGDGIAATRNNSITIATNDANDAGDGELWQIFKRTLLLNHDFSQFYERFQRRNRYTWFLKDSSGYKGPIAPVLTVSD